jgi:Tetratricopeptide repeat/PEGA domain
MVVRRSRRLALICLITTLLSAQGALAAPDAEGQETTAASPAAAEPGSPAAAADAAPSPAGTPNETPPPKAEASSEVPPNDVYLEAKERVGRGEKLFEEGNYDAALAEFERAYQTMEGHPARYLVLFNIGQCYEKLYRYDGAIQAYEGYLKEGGEGAEDAATVKAKMDLLATLLGRLEIHVTVPGGKPVPDFELWVDGRYIGKNPKSALLPGGNHEVEIRAPGFELAKAPLQLPATAQKTLSFELEPLAKEYKGLRPPMFWTTSALAAGTAIAGGVLGFMALDERKRLDQLKAEGEPACGRVYICGEPGADDPVKRISNLATTADVFFIGAGVFGVTAVVLGFMTDFSGHEPETEKKTARILVAPRGAGFTVEGTF